jgi:hypothetical protein
MVKDVGSSTWLTEAASMRTSAGRGDVRRPRRVFFGAFAAS